MLKLDPNISFALIITFCSIISPILTAIINNRHQIKIKRMELNAKQYTETILYTKKIVENYLSAAGKCITIDSPENRADYGKSHNLAMLYIPTIFHASMQELYISVSSKKYNEATNQLFKLTPILSEWLQKIEKQYIR